jgi:hypothetical protein
MTYPSSGFSNNYGPSAPNGVTQGQAPPFSSPAAPANVAQTTPSPATFNSSSGTTSSQNYTAAMIAAADVQTPWNTPWGNADPPTPPGLNIAQTTPSAPTGTFVQSGGAYVTNSSSVLLAGVPASGFTYFSSVTKG